MAGDGVSLQTNIAQLGNVAKAQARGQQTGAVTPGQAPQRDEDVPKLQKVPESEKTGRERLDPNAHRPKDRRPGEDERDEAENEDEQDAARDDADDPRLGNLIDIKA
jgi:hypothetical protein